MHFWKNNMKKEYKPISDQAVLEYQQIYKKEFGIDITLEEALEQGMELLRLFNIIYKPITLK